MTTSVAPKLRARSRRKVESNNIVCCLIRRTLWTSNTWSPRRHRSRRSMPMHWSSCSMRRPRDPQLDPLIAALSTMPIGSGDLQLKPGRSTYFHRPPGIKARRLVVVVAGAATHPAGPSSRFKPHWAARLALLKNGGAKHVAVALGTCGRRRRGACRSVRRRRAAMRSTSIGAPSRAQARRRRLRRFSLVCEKSDARAVQQGLQRGAAIGAGVALAREFANLPGNHCTPTFLGEQALQLGKEHGLTVQVLDRKAVEKLGMGAFVAVPQGSAEPLAVHRGALRRCAARAGAGGAGRQGHHLRYRRHLDQAIGRDGRDEVRHGRRGQRARHAARDRRAQAEAQPGLPDSELRQHAQRIGGQARRRRHQHVGADDRNPEYRCRRPADPVRRADLCRALQAGGRRRHRDADRRLRRSRWATTTAACSPPTSDSPKRCSTPAARRSIRAGGCRSTRNTTRR